MDVETNFHDWLFVWRDVVLVAKLAGVARLFVAARRDERFSHGLFLPSGTDGDAVCFVPVGALLLCV